MICPIFTIVFLVWLYFLLGALWCIRKETKDVSLASLRKKEIRAQWKAMAKEQGISVKALKEINKLARIARKQAKYSKKHNIEV